MNDAALAFIACVLLITLVAAVTKRRRPPRRRVIALGSVSDDVRSRFLAVVLASTLALSVGASGCATTPAPAPTTAPTAPVANRLEQTRRVLDAVRRVGLVVEQVQAAEIALYRSSSVPQLTTPRHLTIQASFKKTAESVIATTSTLAATVTTTDPAIVVRALRTGLQELVDALGALTADQATSLARWLGTAAALIEIALL